MTRSAAVVSLLVGVLAGWLAGGGRARLVVLGRRVGAVALVLVAALGQASPAAAHGGASVTIHSDGRGSVWITAQWQDGHPINEPTPVTLTATLATPASGTPGAPGASETRATSGTAPAPSGAPGAASASASPGTGAAPGGSGQATQIVGQKLTQTGDERGTQTWSGVLPPGAWRVAIDLGAPVEGHCQALVPSAPGTAATAQPVEVACLIAATGATGPAAEPSSTGGSLVPLWVTLGVLLVGGAIAAEFVVRRRRTK
ncbi:hypothetical protein [Dactylosporangium sp. NPDC005555]|uniref:hypothetical protein n=1 Tax=Dactylosporangium sp. NPDC005555 TaxID=3154889 RepID=UPI0033A799C7